MDAPKVSLESIAGFGSFDGELEIDGSNVNTRRGSPSNSPPTAGGSEESSPSKRVQFKRERKSKNSMEDENEDENEELLEINFNAKSRPITIPRDKSSSASLIIPIEFQEGYRFVQLDILTGPDSSDIEDYEWTETSRWIKYEEDLEESSGRWGRPHNSAVFLNALLKARSLIQTEGLISLNTDGKDMGEIGQNTCKMLLNKGLITSASATIFLKAMELKHVHVMEISDWFGIKKPQYASYASLQSLYEDSPGTKVRSPLEQILTKKSSFPKINSSNTIKRQIDSSIEMKIMGVNKESNAMEELMSSSEREGMRKWTQKFTEGSLNLFGRFDELSERIFVFIRLKETPLLFNVTEVPIPVSFIVILLIPKWDDLDLAEVGKSFGSLMANKSFFQRATEAHGRECLLKGLEDFLDECIIFPPGEFEDSNLIPMHKLRTKTRELFLRKQLRKVSLQSCNILNEPDLPLHLTIDDGNPMNRDPFIRTGRPFGGAIDDLKYRYNLYKSDITDSFNLQCVATVCFLYFASIAHVITFGGLLGEKTDNQIGISETIVASSFAGAFFSLTSGQPLLPINPTGPLLLFDELLYKFCRSHEFEYLTVRVWISLWVGLITLILVGFEGSVLVKRFTRFTQEIFANFISVIFTYESIHCLMQVYEVHPLKFVVPTFSSVSLLPIDPFNDTSTFPGNPIDNLGGDMGDLDHQPNTALLSTFLMLGTFFFAYFLKMFKNSIFLPDRVRILLGDFNVPIAIAIMVAIDYNIADEIYTQKLKVPTGIEPSRPELRGWIISPFGSKGDFPLWLIFATAIPAILVSIIVFMTIEICELLISKMKVRKGSGFHLDLIIIGIINIVNSFIGASWVCVATLKALAHVAALTVYSENNPPGQKPTIVKVREQRVTVFIVSILVGCSVAMGSLLRRIPLAVLFGVFLYMGITSFGITQLFARFQLIFIPAKNHPNVVYTRKVRTWKMHVYTGIQIGVLGLLWTVKSIKEISLFFPFVLMMLVPIRHQLKHFFSQIELDALDGDGSEAKAQ